MPWRAPRRCTWKLEQLPWYYLEHKPEFDIAVRHLDGAERILEIGSGAARVGRMVSGRDAYVGLELNLSAVNRP